MNGIFQRITLPFLSPEIIIIVDSSSRITTHIAVTSPTLLCLLFPIAWFLLIAIIFTFACWFAGSIRRSIFQTRTVPSFDPVAISFASLPLAHVPGCRGTQQTQFTRSLCPTKLPTTFFVSISIRTITSLVPNAINFPPGPISHILDVNQFGDDGIVFLLFPFIPVFFSLFQISVCETKLN